MPAPCNIHRLLLTGTLLATKVGAMTHANHAAYYYMCMTVPLNSVHCWRWVPAWIRMKECCMIGAGPLVEE